MGVLYFHSYIQPQIINWVPHIGPVVERMVLAHFSESLPFLRSTIPKFRVRDRVSGIRVRVRFRVMVSRSRVSRVMVSMVRFRVRVSIPSE